MDLNKLTMPEKIISASAIVLFIASFLPWFKAEFRGINYGTLSGWDVGFLWGAVPTILGLVMLAHVTLSKFAPDTKLPELPWPRVHMIAGIVAGALIVLKLLIGEDVGIDRAFGLVLAALAGIGLAAGGFLYNKEAESGTSTAM